MFVVEFVFIYHNISMCIDCLVPMALGVWTR